MFVRDSFSGRIALRIAKKRTNLTQSMLLLTLACALGPGSLPARAADPDPQEAVITRTAEAFVEVFQKGDGKAVASFWTPDGDYVDPSGRAQWTSSHRERLCQPVHREQGTQATHRGRFFEIPDPGHGRGGWDHGSSGPRWHGPEPRPV
jgi:hypothetical protein